MLFPVHPGLRPCGVFSGVNKLLQEVLLAGCGGRDVDEHAMPDGLWSAVTANPATLDAVTSLMGALANMSSDDKLAFWITVRSTPSVQSLTCECNVAIPHVPILARDSLKHLVALLFGQTVKLKGVEVACNDTLIDFYNRYSSQNSPGNGRVCGVCATDVLAQFRSEIANSNQWRGPFDHLLAVAKYPLMALQPANLLPVCHHCNSKAKLAKDLLHDDAGNRRRSFYPWTESAYLMIEMKVSLEATGPSTCVNFKPKSQVDAEKLKTWDTVYDIRRRVRGEFSSFALKISEDLNLESLATIKESLDAKERTLFALKKVSPYNYWRSRLYAAVRLMPDEQLDQLRLLVKKAFDSQLGDCDATFGDLFPV